MFRAKYFTLCEVLMAANSTANQIFPFNPQTQVQTIMGDQTVIVEAIETYANTDITNSPMTTANPVAAPGDIIRATLKLSMRGFEGVSQMPLASLRRTFPNAANGPSVYSMMMFRDCTRIDWVKSGVILCANAVTATTFSFLFGVYYDYLQVQ